jgi:hypothetical protein
MPNIAAHARSPAVPILDIPILDIPILDIPVLDVLF